MKIDPVAHTLPILNPVSWATALSRRATIEMGALPDGGASREKVLAILESLETHLEVARRHERFHPHTMDEVVLKSGYRCITSLPHTGDVQTLRVSSDGVLAVGLNDGSIVVRRRGEYDRPCALTGHSAAVVAIEFLPDGRFISGAIDGTVRVWLPDAEGSGYTSSPVRWCCFPIRSLQVLPGDRLALSCEDGIVRLGGLHGIHYDILRPHDETHYPLSAACSIQVLSDGRIVAGRDCGSISIWTLGHRGWTASGLRAQGVSLLTCHQVLSQDRVVIGGSDSGLVLHSRFGDGWKSKVVSPTGAGLVNCVQALPDDRVVFGTVRADIWIVNLNDTTQSARLVGHAGKIVSLQVLPNGQIVSCATDNQVCIWDGDEVLRPEQQGVVA